MKRRLMVVLVVVMVAAMTVIPASADGPGFGPAIYADGVAWSTKGTADLPAPNDHDRQSFDGLYKFTNGVEGQLAVSEAGPGNPAYNGGRWIEYFVTWNITPPDDPITSFDQLDGFIKSGDVTVVESGNYFQCPLLPVK